MSQSVAASFSKLFDKVVCKLKFVPARHPSKIPHFVKGYRAGPWQKKPLLIELVKLPPESQAATLKNVLRIRVSGQQAADIRKNVSLILQEMLQKLFVAFILGLICQHPTRKEKQLSTARKDAVSLL